MNRTRVELGGRRLPQQARAHESVDGILSAAATLLDEVGLERFNTNLLAARAQVRVATIYRYFPNKYSIIVALTERLAVKWAEWMDDFYAAIADPRQNWRRAVRNCQRQWHRNARTEPGALSVLQAVNATPELGELHVRIFEDMARRLAAAMRTRGLRRPTDQLLAIGRTWVVAQNFGMETYLRLRGPAARRFLEELALSQERYLEPYLDAPAPRRRR